MKKDEQPVVVEEIFKAPLDVVWKAITQVELMRQWFFDNIPAFVPEVGFKTRFDVTSGDRIFPHLWEITEVLPEKKIVYNWQFEGYPGDSFVTFKLSAQSNGTKLTLSQNVTEDFPDDIPEFTRESCTGGWEFFIKKNLKEFLDKL